MLFSVVTIISIERTQKMNEYLYEISCMISAQVIYQMKKLFM